MQFHILYGDRSCNGNKAEHVIKWHVACCSFEVCFLRCVPRFVHEGLLNQLRLAATAQRCHWKMWAGCVDISKFDRCRAASMCIFSFQSSMRIFPFLQGHAGNSRGRIMTIVEPGACRILTCSQHGSHGGLAKLKQLKQLRQLKLINICSLRWNARYAVT